MLSVLVLPILEDKFSQDMLFTDYFRAVRKLCSLTSKDSISLFFTMLDKSKDQTLSEKDLCDLLLSLKTSRGM